MIFSPNRAGTTALRRYPENDDFRVKDDELCIQNDESWKGFYQRTLGVDTKWLWIRPWLSHDLIFLLVRAPKANRSFCVWRQDLKLDVDLFLEAIHTHRPLQILPYIAEV